MIKAKVQGRSRQMLALGLSGENVARLAAGEPILTRLDECGFEGMDLVIVYGTTEDDALADIKTLIEGMNKP